MIRGNLRKSYKVFMFIFLSLFAGCGKEEIFSDEYIKGLDYQYGYDDSFAYSSIVSSDKGYYISMGDYLYYVDKESKDKSVLCSKVSCLHSEEKEIDKKYNCNGFLRTPLLGGTAINYYKGDIYALTDFDYNKKLNDNEILLVKISEDGSKRNIIRSFSGKMTSAIMHRGYLYYVAKEINEGTDSTTLISENTKFSRVDINKNNPKEEVLYKTNLYEDGISSLMAFGKHIYFASYGYKESGLKNYVTKIDSYDIEEKKVTNVFQGDGQSEIGKVDIMEGNLIYSKFYYDLNDERNNEIYSSDLRGENQKELFKAENYGDKFSDDNFIFIDNKFFRGEEKKLDRIIEFYNKEGEKIDSLNLGKDNFISKASLIIPGDENYLFIIYEDEEKLYIKAIEKNEIGSNKIEMKNFFEIDLEDLSSEILY